MQSTLEDEGDFEPNDLGDDATTNLSNAAPGGGSDSLVVLKAHTTLAQIVGNSRTMMVREK